MSSLDADAIAAEAIAQAAPDPEVLDTPDMTVLRLGRRPPPQFPLNVMGVPWSCWISTTALAAACPWTT